VTAGANPVALKRGLDKCVDIIIKEMPDLWQEQEEKWGF
jgi:hypothetical protein